MKKHLPAIVLSAVLGSVITILLLYLFVPSVRDSSNTAKLTQDLTEDSAFMASSQNRLEQYLAGSLSTASLKGDKGDTGDEGATGSTGRIGTSGDDGTDGDDGSDGIDGETGTDGLDGEAGRDGTEGVQGARGLQGPQGERGLQGPIGATGAQGIQGVQGAQGIQGVAGVVSVSATGLTYTSGTQDISLISGYAIPTTTAISNWNSAYSWGDHAAEGYAVLGGQSGGQILIGGTAANEPLTLRANSASTGNSGTTAAITLQVGNSGSVSALSIRHDGNVGIGTTTPASKLTVYGDISVTTNGSNTIKPFQFIQITGLSDFPSITSFGGSAYPVADWNAAVVGMRNGDSCGVPWTNGPVTGFRYWWDTTGGNWRLVIDQGSVNDGCNSVQVMFVRREVSGRTDYGY